MALNTQPNLARPDDFYEALIDMHRGFDDAQSQSVNAQLILLLANHIGDHATLLEAMQHARAGAVQTNPATMQGTAPQQVA